MELLKDFIASFFTFICYFLIAYAGYIIGRNKGIRKTIRLQQKLIEMRNKEKPQC